MIEVFLTFLRLGLTSFGGPVAHLGYFRAEFVTRKRWLDEAAYADIVALCQFLPGPASSQVGMAIGLKRAGIAGALAAWLGFTAPSAIALIAFAVGVAALGDPGHAPWLHGLKIVAAAVVAQAVWGMGRSLCPDRERITLAVAATILTVAVPGPAGQIGALLLGGAFGFWRLREAAGPVPAPLGFTIARGTAIASLIGFFVLLFALPVLAGSSPFLALVSGFYRAGALVFGGGHVVLPLLREAVVPPGWIGDDLFLAGYGAAQAVPGPLFTFAAFLGTAMGPPGGGIAGGIVALLAIFLPSLLLLLGTLPFWDAMRRHPSAAAGLRGVNAAVVGLLLAALYNPVWTGAVTDAADFALVLAAFVALVFWRVPPWLVVPLGAVAASMSAAIMP
jgi:chromate transporter